MKKINYYNLQKYNELDGDFFSTNANWTYSWKYNNDRYCLDWDFDKKAYSYYINNIKIAEYEDIYSALDLIKIDNYSLKQLILETDFDFSEIN